MIVDWAGSFYIFTAETGAERSALRFLFGSPSGETNVEQRYVDGVVAGLATRGVVAFARPDGEPIERVWGSWILLHWPYDVAGWDRLAKRRVAA